MAVALGKRKRAGVDKLRSTKRSDSDEEGDDAALRARFQKAFEAKFQPLPQDQLRRSKVVDRADAVDEDEDEDGDDTSDGSEWSGFSDDEEVVEVVRHDTAEKSREDDEEDQRREMKAFMSSKPPSSSVESGGSRPKKKKKNHGKGEDEDGTTEANHLKNDLALQRFLKESHLLDPSGFAASSRDGRTGPEGKARIKALDLRLQDLGAKKGLDADVKMPMAHRKGILAKASGKETRRRAEAKENGIILEKPVAGRGKGGERNKRRDRGVGGPSVGKFRGGTLSLSRKDVKSIQGACAAGGKKGRRR